LELLKVLLFFPFRFGVIKSSAVFSLFRFGVIKSSVLFSSSDLELLKGLQFFPFRLGVIKSSVLFSSSDLELLKVLFFFPLQIWQIKVDVDGKSSVEFLANLKRHTKAVNVCRFSPDGRKKSRAKFRHLL